jgi:hypothetical protein
VGIELGIGEVLQGGAVPDGVIILPWLESALFALSAG